MLDTTVNSHYFDGVSFTKHFGFLEGGEGWGHRLFADLRLEFFRCFWPSLYLFFFKSLLCITLVETSATKFFRFGLNISIGWPSNSILPKTFPCSGEKIGVCPNAVQGGTVYNHKNYTIVSTLSLMIFVSILVSMPNNAGTYMKRKNNEHLFLIAFIIYLFCIFRAKKSNKSCNHS